jgi:hypothetical protein
MCTEKPRPIARHTPGPWVYTLDAKGICGIHQSNNATGVPVRIGEVVSNVQNQAEANARLIAGAPDLLEALDYLLEQTVDMDMKYGIALSEGEDDARAKALAAIAKATPELSEGRPA